jgi:hypothetical protein
MGARPYALADRRRRAEDRDEAPAGQGEDLIPNTSVAGKRPGPPEQTTEFPQQFSVGYVRVYQSQSVRTLSR